MAENIFFNATIGVYATGCQRIKQSFSLPEGRRDCGALKNIAYRITSLVYGIVLLIPVVNTFLYCFKKLVISSKPKSSDSSFSAKIERTNSHQSLQEGATSSSTFDSESKEFLTNLQSPKRTKHRGGILTAMSPASPYIPGSRLLVSNSPG